MIIKSRKQINSLVMQLDQIRNVHASLHVHLSNERGQESLYHKLGVPCDTLTQRDILVPPQGIAVQLHHIVEYIAEAANEILQELQGVDTEDVVHEVNGHDAEVDGGPTEVHDPLMD